MCSMIKAVEPAEVDDKLTRMHSVVVVETFDLVR